MPRCQTVVSGRDVDPHIVALIGRCERLWAAEAEVARTYWDSPARSTATDRLWLLRQMYKELIDGAVPSLTHVHHHLAGVHTAADRAEFLEELSILRDEYTHYAGFAAIYEALDGVVPAAAALREQGAWPENDRLQALRAEHRRQYGLLGLRAQRFTEGGYCTLYSEGMKLAARGGVDALIAGACAVVFEDEFGHMLRGIADLIAAPDALTDAEWRQLGGLVEQQLQHRILMRNAQFSQPLGAKRLAAVLAGACEPLSFDYVRAFGGAAPRLPPD